METVEVSVEAILFDLTTNAPVVLLKDKEGKRILPIWIGAFEAQSIEMELQSIKPPRPLTHDLLKSFLDQLGGKVEKIVVTDLQKSTFLATIFISVNGNVVEIDSRPSDAIALALRAKAPIFAVEWILKEASYFDDEETSDDEHTRFKKFLENLKPDDFKYQH